jgi:hypothetical protein
LLQFTSLLFLWESLPRNTHYRFLGLTNYSGPEYLLAVEAAFNNWEAMQNAGR